MESWDCRNIGLFLQMINLWWVADYFALDNTLDTRLRTREHVSSKEHVFLERLCLADVLVEAGVAARLGVGGVYEGCHMWKTNK